MKGPQLRPNLATHQNRVRRAGLEAGRPEQVRKAPTVFQFKQMGWGVWGMEELLLWDKRILVLSTTGVVEKAQAPGQTLPPSLEHRERQCLPESINHGQQQAFPRGFKVGAFCHCPLTLPWSMSKDRTEVEPEKREKLSELGEKGEIGLQNRLSPQSPRLWDGYFWGDGKAPFLLEKLFIPSLP